MASASEPQQIGRRSRRATVATKPVADALLTEAVLRSALIRERRRADRSNEGFALLRARCEGSGVEAVVRAAFVAAPAPSLVGWMREGCELGIVLPDLPKEAASDVAQRVERNFRQELIRQAGAESAGRQCIDTYVHTGPAAAAASDDPDPMLAELRRGEARRPLYLTAKRLLDIVGSAALLILCTPVFIVAAALVKASSPGPVFFRQQRAGLNAKPFTMLKFRTMTADNDPALHKAFVSDFITKSGTHVAAKTGDAPFKIKADPRVTPIGRLLRRSSLDELPQLWNVLVGDMSLVGPRPPIDYELARYQAWHWRRVLEAKPGMTGLWQVMGRSRTTFDEMVRMDLAYARDRSLLMDIRLILATPRAMFTGKGAY